MTSAVNTFVQTCSEIEPSDDEWVNNDTYHPKLEEILKNCGSNEYAVQHRVGEEKKEKLVVGKTNTVVNPERERNHKGQSRIYKSISHNFKIQAVITYQGQ